MQAVGLKPDNRFTQHHRLHTHGVSQVLRNGKRQTGATLDLKWSVAAERPFSATGRFAVSVPKRLQKRAVARNRIKRILRETFRMHAIKAQPLDLLLVFKSKADFRSKAGRASLAIEVARLLGTAGRKAGAPPIIPASKPANP